MTINIDHKVPAGAKLRKYLGFNRKDRDTQLEAVAEDRWAEARLKGIGCRDCAVVFLKSE